VIGAGLSGLTAAVELSRRGMNTAIIYNQDDLHDATKAAHGISTIKGILESDAELFGLKLDGHRGFSDWLAGVESMIGRSRPEAAWLTGVEESFQTYEYFRKEFGRIYRKDFIGAKRVMWLDSSDGAFAKVVYPGDWWIDPQYLVDTLWLAIKYLDVGVVEGVVDCLGINPSRIFVKMDDGVTLDARNIIVSAGAGTPGIFHRSNMELNQKIFAVPGSTFTGVCENRKNHAIVKGTSGIIHKEHKVFWGATSEEAKLLKGSEDVSSAVVRKKQDEGLIAAQHLEKLLSGQAKDDVRNVDIRWGVRVRSKLRDPILETLLRSDVGSIWINTGYYKSGIILSWIMAKRLANVIAAEYPYSSSH
jgi:glycine/D-amino acid oxidase-like deaminating enzyme